MTTARRWLLMPVLSVALLLGGISPAQAGYNSSRSLPAMSVGTLEVAAPTGLSVAGTRCVSSHNATTGTWTSTLQARVDWNASAARGVTGYVVNAVLPDGSTYPVTSTSAAATSASGTYDVHYASQHIRVTITAMTRYGWTAESAPSGAITC